MNIINKIIAAIAVIGFTLPVFAQTPNWQNKDLQQDGFFGISTEKAYTELLRGKKPQSTIVGLIDTGIDTLHEDLKSVIWTDPKTGSHGWNYIGPETSREDVTNLVGNKKAFYDSLAFNGVPQEYRNGYQAYRKVALALEYKIHSMENLLSQLQQVHNPLADSFAHITDYHLKHGLNIDNREADTARGNSDVSPDQTTPIPHPSLISIHGTHVAGIIGAVRNNGMGIDGIANYVQIMMLKANGDIRELRDKSLANGILFAVDHGAKVINISLGKPYTWDKKDVDDAVKYAMQKDVLIVHAAGNDGNDIEKVPHFPNPVYADSSGKANAWIEVGATGPKDDNTLLWQYSNYGVKSVDVFAPGVDIYSTIPGNAYRSFSGTSMAAPVVTGAAALIREYYPKLTAIQVKDIIMKTVIKRDILKDKCVSGGVVNAYNALKLAGAYK